MQDEITSVEKGITGAESVVRSLLASGVDTCFANPGTSEMHFVAALDRVTGMRPVPCLFEGVATGAADGYARMSGRPAATLLHLGPGLANGLSNLHNAKRALSPIVNIVGEHAHSHRQFDAPLSSDIEGLARPVSAFVRMVLDVAEAGRDAAQAVAAARSYRQSQPSSHRRTSVGAWAVKWPRRFGRHRRASLMRRASQPRPTHSRPRVTRQS